MQVFFGAATVLGCESHVGIESLRGMLPGKWAAALESGAKSPRMLWQLDSGLEANLAS
jgi:TRAP-type C4-dicarboxylate transport system permease small subunit